MSKLKQLTNKTNGMLQDAIKIAYVIGWPLKFLWSNRKCSVVRVLVEYMKILIWLISDTDLKGSYLGYESPVVSISFFLKGK